MSDYTAEIQLQDHKRNDVWIGIPAIGPIKFDGETPPKNLVRVRMYLRTRSGAQYMLDSNDESNPDAPIVIDDPVEWTCHVPPVDKFVQLVEPWSWDMEFYELDAKSPLTLLKGVLTVNPDISR